MSGRLAALRLRGLLSDSRGATAEGAEPGHCLFKQSRGRQEGASPRNELLHLAAFPS